MKTPITYYGGKQQLASQIIAMIPPHKINIYSLAEVWKVTKDRRL